MSKVRAMRDEDIDTSDIPELGKDFWDRADMVRPVAKVPVTLRLDKDVMAYFREGGSGYQTRINAALRGVMVSHRKSHAAKRRARR